MRIRTELSDIPRPYTVTNDSGTARIRFYEDVHEEQREEGVVYTATMWEMSCPWMQNLEQRVRNNPNLWLTKIKTITKKEEANKELKRIKETGNDNAICELADIVAELIDAVTEIAEIIA